MIPLVATYLFVPGDMPARIEKAFSSGAGAVVVDLEDAVGLENKQLARAALRDLLACKRNFVLRINAVASEWHDYDLAIIDAGPPAALMVPKAESANELAALACRFPDTTLLPLIETARGLDASRDIAGAPNVQRLVFGSMDFQLDLGISGNGDELLFARSHLVFVSKLAGIARPVDGVTLAIEGPGVIDDARRAKRAGFGAKLCIHPRQLEPVAAAFQPSQAEYEHALRVVSIASNSCGSMLLDGQMIDRPVVELARQIISDVESSSVA